MKLELNKAYAPDNTVAAYDEFAEDYVIHMQKKSEVEIYDRHVFRSFLKDMEGKNVLDVGCGTGYYSEYCIGQGSKVTAVDCSIKLLNILAAHLKSDKLRIVRADISEPIPTISSDSQDYVICNFVLHYFKDWATPISEFYRVLKPKGLLLISVHHPFYDYNHLHKSDYFFSGYVEDEWEINNKLIKISIYTRPLKDILEPIVNSSFKIIRIDEPRPEGRFGELVKFPGILFLALQK